MKLDMRLGDWLPFATAPDDGSEILVYREDAGVFTAFFAEPTDPTGEEDDWFWCSMNGEDLTGELPSHWMPFPEAPIVAGGTR